MALWGVFPEVYGCKFSVIADTATNINALPCIRPAPSPCNVPHLSPCAPPSTSLCAPLALSWDWKCKFLLCDYVGECLVIYVTIDAIARSQRRALSNFRCLMSMMELTYIQVGACSGGLALVDACWAGLRIAVGGVEGVDERGEEKEVVTQQ